MAKVWMNGRFIDDRNAKVPIYDRGFLYGDSVFETMRSYGGRVFKLEDHLSRMFAAFKVIGMPAPYSKPFIARAVNGLLERNRLKDAYVRVQVTRGEGRFGITYKDDFRPNVVIVAKHFEGYPPSTHSKGLSARVVTLRLNELSPVSRIKSGNFLPYVMARFEAKKSGADEAILLNTKGDVAEAATSNVFLVKRGSLVTPHPDSGILPGITRGAVIGLARRLGLKVAERRVARRELHSADEIFLTNSLAELIPVASIDRKKVSSGLPGPVTKLLHLQYRLLVT
jgi:branched-chain amino acid aminotransferase